MSIEQIFSSPAMDAVFGPVAQLRHMLRFESALARAQAYAGLIPQDAADAIVEACHPEQFDRAVLYREAAKTGTPVIPLVRQLTALAGPGADYVHWGATSQDVIDTAHVLQMLEGLALLDADLRRGADICALLADQHRHTLMIGRTLMQPALPISFGLKAARWLALLVRQQRALHQVAQQTLVLQFGGAAGTLAALGPQGMQVAELLSQELELALPDLPWHAERDRIAQIAAALGVLAGSVAKIAHDLVLLGQAEVAEVSEASAPGKGGSSAMPQKQNPVDAMLALAAAQQVPGLVATILSAMPQEHERAVGGWQAEWVTIPALFRATSGALSHTVAALSGLRVDAERMRQNLASVGTLMAESLSMALAAQHGRPAAQKLVRRLVEQAQAEQRSLAAVARADSQVRAALTPDALEQALDPQRYLGSTEALIERALAEYATLRIDEV